HWGGGTVDGRGLGRWVGGGHLDEHARPHGIDRAECRPGPRRDLADLVRDDGADGARDDAGDDTDPATTGRGARRGAAAVGTGPGVNPLPPEVDFIEPRS